MITSTPRTINAVNSVEGNGTGFTVWVGETDSDGFKVGFKDEVGFGVSVGAGLGVGVGV